MSKVSAANSERKVTVAARVPPALAEAVRNLADAGDRSLSREILRAVQAHVKSSGGSRRPVPAERGETSEPAGQSSSPAQAGQESF